MRDDLDLEGEMFLLEQNVETHDWDETDHWANFGSYTVGGIQPNQLRRTLLGINAMNPFDGCDSASRKQMFANHLGQALVVFGATERRIQTGMEREYGKYTFGVRQPHDGQIRRVISRYPQTLGADSIAFSPQTVAIYEHRHNKEIGVVNLPRFSQHHPYFGFEYVAGSASMRLVTDARVDQGEVYYQSPAIGENGEYKYGVECNMAFMSHPAVSEDGIMISRDVLKKFTFKTYENRVVEWGSKRFPLNLYGNPNDPSEYKPFPDIGDYVRDDGLLMMLREYDTELAIVEQNIHDLREPDFIFDRATYAAGAGGRIVDIRVYHDGHLQHGGTPEGMEVQPMRYDKARREFYQAIYDEYRRLRYERRDALRLTPEFNRLVVEALSVVGRTADGLLEPVRKLYRQAPLDDWRVEFVIEYTITPDIGFKMTGCHGDKGVICYIADPSEMPVDAAGNRADIVMDPNSTISRMNIGRLYEQYINAASRDVSKRVREMLGIAQEDRQALQKIVAMEASNPQLLEQVMNYLAGYYEICSPKMYSWFAVREAGDNFYMRPRSEHLASVVKDGVYLYMPPDNPPELKEMVKRIEAYVQPTYGPVSYIGTSGQRVTTKNPVRIGSCYIMLLEKIADDWSAVSSGKLQHFGVLSQVTNVDKYSQPTRQHAVRALGEAEVRIYTSYVGPELTTDILDRNNNPFTHRQIAHNILAAPHPTNIYSVVDRIKTPLGGSKPLQLVKHIAMCGGWKFVYTDEQE